MNAHALIRCASCGCHARPEARCCPHCDHPLAPAMPRGGRREVRRMVVAVAMGVSAACGGASSDPRVVGGCAPNGGSQTLSCTTQCTCGLNGACDAAGLCHDCGCGDTQRCDGTVGHCSTHSCYGSPPALA